MIALLLGCNANNAFVETAGGPVVASLAGCSYTSEQAIDGGTFTQSYVYDGEGHLREEGWSNSWNGAFGWTHHEWVGDCRVAARTGGSYSVGAPGSGEGTRDRVVGGTPADLVVLNACDTADNLVRRVQAVVTSDASMFVTADLAYENTYDADEQLASVLSYDAMSEEPRLLSVDEYIWNSDGRPRILTRVEPQTHGSIPLAQTETTWIWDHELLLMMETRGTGTDTQIERLYETRHGRGKLIEEDLYHDDVIVGETEWSYDDEGAPFPYLQVTWGAFSMTSQVWAISVVCD